jgi:kynurenine formamidase
LLLAGIPMVDALLGLDQIKKSRVFFIALPAKLRRVTASWTRAVALEEIDD